MSQFTWMYQLRLRSRMVENTTRWMIFKSHFPPCPYPDVTLFCVSILYGGYAHVYKRVPYGTRLYPWARMFLMQIERRKVAEMSSKFAHMVLVQSTMHFRVFFLIFGGQQCFLKKRRIWVITVDHCQ